MNYCFIGELAGQAAADKIRDNFIYDHIAAASGPIDAEALDSVTRGAVILGVEPVDYPLTDGLYIYLKRPGGDVVTIYLEAEPDAEGEHPCLMATGAAIAKGA